MTAHALAVETWRATAAETAADLAAWDVSGYDRETAAELALTVREIADTYRAAAERLDERICALSEPGDTFTVGAVAVTPRRSARRTGWDNDALVRAVLDSRLVDRETGEIVDESPADRLRACFNLSGSNVRLTALKARRIDPDELCSTEWRSTVQYQR